MVAGAGAGAGESVLGGDRASVWGDSGGSGDGRWGGRRTSELHATELCTQNIKW